MSHDLYCIGWYLPRHTADKVTRVKTNTFSILLCDKCLVDYSKDNAPRPASRTLDQALHGFKLFGDGLISNIPASDVTLILAEIERLRDQVSLLRHEAISQSAEENDIRRMLGKPLLPTEE